MPGKLIINGIEYTNTNPTTVIKQGEGLSHIIEREWGLPGKDDLPFNFWLGPKDLESLSEADTGGAEQVVGDGYKLMKEISELDSNSLSVGFVAIPENSWKDFQLVLGQTLYLPFEQPSENIEAPDSPVEASGPAHSQALVVHEPTKIPGATHYIFHDYLYIQYPEEDPEFANADLSIEDLEKLESRVDYAAEAVDIIELEKSNNIFQIEEYRKGDNTGGILPLLGVEILPDGSWQNSIGKPSQYEPHLKTQSLTPGGSPGIDFIIPWKSQVKVVETKEIKGTTFHRIEPPMLYGDSNYDVNLASVWWNIWRTYKDGYNTIDLEVLSAIEENPNVSVESGTGWWIDANLLTRFGSEKPTLKVNQVPPGPHAPIGEPSFEVTSGDNWVNVVEEIEPHYIPFNPFTGSEDDHWYVVRVNMPYQANSDTPEEERVKILSDALKESTYIGAARLLKYFGKDLNPNPVMFTETRAYVDYYIEDFDTSDPNGLYEDGGDGRPFGYITYQISTRPSKKPLSVLIGAPQKHFDALPFKNLKDWQDEVVGNLETQYTDDPWWTLGLPVTRTSSDIFTIAANSDQFVKDVKEVADILDRFHGRVEHFKNVGGDVRQLDCAREANLLRDSIDYINKFLNFRWQGGNDWNALRPDLNQTRYMEIGLNNKLELIYFSFEQSKEPFDVVPQIVGLDYLRDKISPRTFGFMLYAKNIKEYMESRSGPAGFVNDSGQTYSAAQVGADGPPSLTVSEFDTLQEIGGQAASTDEWVDFITKFVYPVVAIRPSKNRKDPKYEECVKKMQALDRIPVKTEDQFLLEERLLGDSECKRIILEERRNVQEVIGDPSLDQENVSWLSKHPALSETLAELHRIYQIIANEIDMKVYAKEIIICILKKNGLPTTPEAICEMIINYLVSEVGISAFAGILYGNPKTRKIVKSDKFQALLAETTAGATAVSVGAEEAAASAGAITAAPGAVADGIIEASDGVSEIMGDAPYSTFEPGTGSNAQQISQFVQGLKDFVDFRRLCEDLVKIGLDLPGKWLSGDFSLPDFGDTFPSFPDPIVWKPLSFWKPRGISHDFWQDVYDATITVLAKQVAKAIKAVLDDFLKNCFEETDEANQASYGGAKNLIPGFGPQGGPPPRQVFNNWNMPNDSNRIQEFLGRVADMLTARELCRLLQGQPSETVLTAIMDLIKDEFPEYLLSLPRKSDIRYFFTDIGATMDLSICDTFETFVTISEDFCNDLYNTEEKCAALREAGLPEDECTKKVKEQLENDLNKLKGLANLLQSNANDYLEDKMPPLNCSNQGILPGVPPGLQLANQSIIDAIFDNVVISFYRELRGLGTLLKDLKPEDIANIADAAKGFETEKWVGMLTEGAKSGEIAFDTNWTDSQLKDGSSGFLKSIKEGDILGPLPAAPYPIKKLNSSIVNGDSLIDALLAGQVKSDEAVATLDLGVTSFDIPNILPQSLLEDNGGIVELPKLRGPNDEDMISKLLSLGEFITFAHYHKILQNKDNFYWQRNSNNSNYHVLKIPTKDQEAAELLRKYSQSFDFLASRDQNLSEAVNILNDTLTDIESNNNDVDFIKVGGTGRSVKYQTLDLEISNGLFPEPASSFKLEVLDNRGKKSASNNVVKSVEFKSKYTDEYKSTLEALGLNFDNAENAFGQFVTNKIEEHIKNVYPDVSLSNQMKNKSNEFFTNFAHPLITQKILSNMMKINLQSPAFELKTFERIFSQLFPNSSICWPENPDFSEGILTMNALKEDINERLEDVLCKEWTKTMKSRKEASEDEGSQASAMSKRMREEKERQNNRLGKGKDLRPIEKATITGLISARIKIGIIQELFYYMPLIPVYDFKSLIYDDLFIEQTYERVKTSIFEDQNRFTNSSGIFDFIEEQAQDMIKDKISSGQGKTRQHPQTPAPPDKVTHVHSYYIDSEGNGYTKEIVQGDHPAHVHIIKDYLIQYAPGHEHLHYLEEKHTIPNKSDAFKILLEQEYSEITETIWHAFKSKKKKDKFKPRIRNYVDLFNWVGEIDRGFKTIAPGPIQTSPATKGQIWPTMPDIENSVKFGVEHHADPHPMPSHIINKGVRYDNHEFWSSSNEFRKLLQEDYGNKIKFASALAGGGVLDSSGDLSQIQDHPGMFVLEPYIWIDHKESTTWPGWSFTEEQQQEANKKYKNLYNQNMKKPKFMDLLDEQEVTEQGEVVGYYLNVSAKKEKIHEYGVADLNTWSEIITEYVENSDDEDSKVDDYFNNFCFGLRLVYQFPLYFAVDKDNNNDNPTRKTAQGVCDLLGEIHDDMDGKGDIGRVSWKYKTFLGAVDQSIKWSEMPENDYAFAKIPLADVKIPVWKFVEELCDRTTNPLPKSSQLRFADLAEGKLISYFYTGQKGAYSELLRNLHASDEFKFLFKHVFKYERMLMLNAFYASYANTDIGELSQFSATKAIILSFMRNMLGDVDNLSDNVPFLDQFGGMIGLSEMQDFSSTSGKFPQNPLEDQLKAIVKETPKLILKALAEITDPCVMTGKAINDAIILIIETTLKVAEEVAKAAFDTHAAVVDFNKNLVDGLYMMIKQVEQTIPPLEQQVDAMPSFNAEQQAAKAQKKQELQDLKDDLASKRQAMVDALTLLYGEYKGDVKGPGDEDPLEIQFPKDKNPEYYDDKDWIKPPETKIYMAPKKVPGTAEEGIHIEASDVSKQAWPEYSQFGETLGSHHLAELEFEFNKAVRKTRNSLKAVDPYLLPIICFLLFPSSMPYGLGFIGFTPPPAGIGIGPPITPLGFIHLIMVSLGFADDYEKWLKGEVDNIETEKELSEEGDEEC